MIFQYYPASTINPSSPGTNSDFLKATNRSIVLGKSYAIYNNQSYIKALSVVMNNMYNIVSNFPDIFINKRLLRQDHFSVYKSTKLH